MPVRFTKDEDTQCRSIYTAITTALTRRPKLLGGELGWCPPPATFPGEPMAHGCITLSGLPADVDSLIYNLTDKEELGILPKDAPRKLVRHALRLIAKQGGKS